MFVLFLCLIVFGDGPSGVAVLFGLFAFGCLFLFDCLTSWWLFACIVWLFGLLLIIGLLSCFAGLFACTFGGCGLAPLLAFGFRFDFRNTVGFLALFGF